ncbi:response regulator [Wolinella succinogenes]|nr:response regulator [Wolinella succinogenes]NLU35167.1 response regulator [Wolinella succinogenes]VEG80515.1 Uncharacterized response regulatory protein SA0215 [Wolinella succinogenes]
MEREVALKILIVEDDTDAREWLSTIISNHFPEVWSAGDGEEGERLFGLHAPDVIITDIRMPKLGGLEMLDRIKAGGAKPYVIVISAFSEMKYFIKAIELGVHLFLPKPIEPGRLMETLEDFRHIKLAKLKKEEAEQERIRSLLFESKKELIRLIAHHWRQPLNVISITAENIKLNLDERGIEGHEDTHHLADKIVTESLRLSRVISRFSDTFFAKEEVGRHFGLHTVLKDAFEIAEPLAQEARCLLEIEGNDEVIFGLKGMLVQILLEVFKAIMALCDQVNRGELLVRVVCESFEGEVKIWMADVACAGRCWSEVMFEPFAGGFEEKRRDMELFVAQHLLRRYFDGMIKIVDRGEIRGLEITLSRNPKKFNSPLA